MFAVLMMAHVEPGTIRVRACYVGPEVEAVMRWVWADLAESGDSLGFECPSSLDVAVVSVFQVPSLSPSEAAAMELALDGVRRVRALGELYGSPEVEVAEQQSGCSQKRRCCPYDGSELLRVPGRLQPIEKLEREGYRDLAVVRKEVAAMRASPPRAAA
jgi:hypothetical protein